MPNIRDWDIVASGGVKTLQDEQEITAIYNNEIIAKIRFTPRGVFTIDARECTVYVKPEIKTVEISFIRGL